LLPYKTNARHLNYKVVKNIVVNYIFRFLSMYKRSIYNFLLILQPIINFIIAKRKERKSLEKYT